MSLSSSCMNVYKHALVKSVRRAVVRYCIYGALMLAGEISFYTISKIGRTLPDWISWFFNYSWRVDPVLDLNHIWDVPITTFYGQASLWMFFVYASIFVFGLEPMYARIKYSLNWFVRGLIYMGIILAMECLTGWILFWLTGWSIWYYADGPLTIFTYTSFAIAPMWFVLGVISERVIDIIYRLSEMKGILKENNLPTRRS
ncbi:MAG: hypothetical protein OCC49_12510 [Fibrobacterales bacterium]